MQPRVGFEQCFQVRPAGGIHVVECVQINGHDFVRIFAEQNFDGGFQLRVIHRRRQILHHAVFVRDAKRVQKIHQHRRVFFHQPGADEGGGGAVELGLGQRGKHRGVPLSARLALQKNRADVLGFGDGGERGLVGRLVGLEDEGQNIIRQRGRHETEEFVGLEQKN